MEDLFFTHPVLNSPYEYPSRHWELDESGQPTHRISAGRRPAEFRTPIPQPKKTKGQPVQARLAVDEAGGQSEDDQQSELAARVGEIRGHVDAWREIPGPDNWGVTPETARLLQHWRDYDFGSYRPFFCQLEAVETMIWLTEVAPRERPEIRGVLNQLDEASKNANPELLRMALKLATGAGKTTVMAMLIAWQTVNAVRRPTSRNFTRGFLIVTPGITIKDRLRVLQPNDPENYSVARELVPTDMREDIKRAKIVITNYHAFMLRERMDLSSGGRALLQGRGSDLLTRETEGQMIQRVMPDLMGLKNILVMNDEGHHCYREKPETEERALKVDERQEANKNNEAARVWITGLESVKRKVGVQRVVDLSATPFFLRGSGYEEGTLFPWTVSNFSLMDAIECGIVKLPRVPVSDNIPGSEMPTYRALWENIRRDMPKKGRGKAKGLEPLELPVTLRTALDVLYGHYNKTFDLWQDAEITVPPCFVIVCNNTSTSKLVYDYVSGFEREDSDGKKHAVPGHLALFRNHDEFGNRLARPNTILIDSEQLESGEALNIDFRTMAAAEIEQFRIEQVERTGDRREAENVTDHDLLREVMNTVGKEDRLGGLIRCVVSVSMLTEGWDANNVTHILGVRAFGTQLLCEQVVGRALRRQSYELNEQNRFNVEYADVLGVPFDFTSQPVRPRPQPPQHLLHVMAVRPDRDASEIRFPRVAGYRVELPRKELSARFTRDSVLPLTPELVGPTRTRNEGIIGEGVDLNLVHTQDLRLPTVAYHLTKHLLLTKWRDNGNELPVAFFGRLKRFVTQWLDECLVCSGGTYPAQLMYPSLAEMACERIMAAITRASTKGVQSNGQGIQMPRVLLDPFNPTGSTMHVNFRTSKVGWRSDPRRCHVNYVILDGDWEKEFCDVVQGHPRVLAYVKNHGLSFEVPYHLAGVKRTYVPDFIVVLDDGRGADDPLHLVVEIKGYRGEDAKQKKETMETYWVPGVNALGAYGRWAFAEFTDVYEMEDAFAQLVDEFVATPVAGGR